MRLAEAVPVTGGLLFELLAIDGRGMPSGGKSAVRGTPRRQLVKSRVRRDKTGRPEMCPRVDTQPTF